MAAQARHVSSARLGTELLEHRICGVEFELSGVLVAEAAVGMGEQQPGIGRMVRRVEVLPARGTRRAAR